MVFHEDENTSVLVVKIFPKELLYSMANPEGQYRATMKINFQLVDIENPENKNSDASCMDIVKVRRYG